LTEKLQRLKQESLSHSEEIARYEQRIDEYKNISSTIDKKTADLESTLRSTTEEQAKLKEVQIQQLSSIDLVSFDIDVLMGELKELEELEEQTKLKQKEELK
jgi:hypothetical protein